MPRFIVTKGSAYDPFTYEELATPLMQAQALQNAAEEKFDEYSANTEALRTYITDNPNDSDAKRMYDNYVQKLATLQSNLYNNGYNAQTRRDLSAAKQAYNGDIARIATEIKNRQERGALYRKMKMEHPDMVMGKDPSYGGLNDYLRDPLYGTDFYTYSGSEFAKEVATEMKARAAEMMDDPRIKKDPEMVGYLMQIINEDFTNQQVDDAYHAALAKYRDGEDSSDRLDIKSKVIYDALLTQMEHTGAPKAYENGRLDKDELLRLLGYGRIGAASAITKPTVNNLKDLEYENQQAMKRVYAAARRSSGGNDNDGGNAGTGTYTEYGKAGEGHGKAVRELNRFYNKDKDHTVFRPDGSAVDNSADASAIYYSQDMRNRAIDPRTGMGFDPVTAKTGKWVIPRNYTTGTYIGPDGQEYESRYNPRTQTVQSRPVGTRVGGWEDEVEKTAMFNETIERYNRRRENLSATEPELAEMASIDPSKQERFSERKGIDRYTDVRDIGDAYMAKPENRVENVTYTHVARKGTDPGKFIDRITSLLADSFEYDKNNKVTSYSNPGVNDGVFSRGIHIMGPHTPEHKAVADPNKVLTFDKDGKITNVNSVDITRDAILNGYIILNLSGKIKKIAIGIDDIHDDGLKHEFATAIHNSRGTGILDVVNAYRLAGLQLDNDAYNSIQKNIENVRKVAIKAFGFDQTTQTRGGTVKEDSDFETK